MEAEEIRDQFKFARRTDAEMDSASVAHQREHDEHVERSAKVLSEFQTLILAAPCAAAAMGTLQIMEQVVQAGQALVVTVELIRQRDLARGQADQTEQASDPDQPLPDIWGGLFSSDGGLNPV